MIPAEDKVKGINLADYSAIAKCAESLGMNLEDTTKDLKDSKGVVVETVRFAKVLFDGREVEEIQDKAGNVIVQTVAKSTKNADALFADAVAFFARVYPDKDPVLSILEKLTAQFDLNVRSAIDARNRARLEGPGNAIVRAAKSIMAQTGCTEAEAVQRAKIAFGVA